MSLLFENQCEGCGKEFSDGERVFVYSSATGKVNHEITLIRGNKTTTSPFEVYAYLEVFCRPCFNTMIKEVHNGIQQPL